MRSRLEWFARIISPASFCVLLFCAVITNSSYAQVVPVKIIDAPLMRDEKSNWPRAVDFSDDGKIIGYGDVDGTLYLLDSKSGKPIAACDGSQPNKSQKMSVRDFVIGKRQVSVVYQNHAVGFFSRKGKRKGAPVIFTNGSIDEGHIQLSRDGTMVATSKFLGDNGQGFQLSVELFDIKNGRALASFQLPGYPGDVEFRPDGKEVACVGQTKVYFANLKGKPTRKPVDVEFGMVQIKYSPDGKTLLALGGESEKFALIDIDSGDVTVNSKAEDNTKFKDKFIAGAFSSDGLHFVAASHAEISICDAKTGKILGSHPCSPVIPDYVQFSPDGKTLAVTGRRHSGSPKIQLWNIEAMLSPVGFDHFELNPFPPSDDDSVNHAIEFSSNSNRLFVACDSKPEVPKDIGAWNLESQKLEQRFGAPDTRGITRIPGSDDRLLVSREKAFQIWDVSGAKAVLEKEIPLKIEMISHTISPDGQFVFVRKRLGGELRRFSDLDKPGQSFFESGMKTLSPVHFSGDSKYFCGNDGETLLRLHRIKDGKMIYETELPNFASTEIAFSPTSNEMAFVGKNRKISILDISKAEVVRTIPLINIESKIFTEFTYSPDGRYLFGGSSKGRVFAWDVETGAMLAKIADHKAGENVTAIVFSPDQKLMATSAFDDGVLVYEFDSMVQQWGSAADEDGKPKKNAKKMANRPQDDKTNPLPDGELPSSDPPGKTAKALQVRKWTSANGGFTTDAIFVRRSGDSVVIRNNSGKERTVPLEKLCDADRAYVESIENE